MVMTTQAPPRGAVQSQWEPAAAAEPALQPVVRIVEDDNEMRRLLRWMIETAGMRAETYASGVDFLNEFRQRTADGALDSSPSCLICDVMLPRMSGLDLHEAYSRDGGRWPTIFVTAHADVPMVVRAFKSGAAEFVQKPFNRNDLLERIQRAIRADAGRCARETALTELDRRFAELSEREREVLDCLELGLPNRAIAARAGITVRAVEMRRAALMKKVGAASLAELLRFAWCVETRTPTLNN